MADPTNTAPEAQAQAPQAYIYPDVAAIQQVNELIRIGGLTLPEGYNHVTAIKMAFLMLQGMFGKNDQYPLAFACEYNSVVNALVQMALDGLDATKKQCYFSKSGNALKYAKEYHSKRLDVQRLYPNYTPSPKVIYEGDEFEYDTDPKTGRHFLVKHKQSLANLDNDFIGAYIYIPCNDGGQDLFIMTKKMIVTAWSNSRQGQATHNKYTAKMVQKTIMNSALDTVIYGGKNTGQVASVSQIAEDDDEVPMVVEEPEDIDVDSVETETV